jgi:uncharacterized protein (DUF1778 family)
MYATKNITFRAYEIQIDLIQRAADKRGVSLSDFCRDLLVPAAAKELGEEPPPLPKIERGRYGSIIAKAAKALGMTREEYEARVIQQEAARIMADAATLPAKPKRGLGVHQGGRTGPIKASKKRARKID